MSGLGYFAMAVLLAPLLYLLLRGRYVEAVSYGVFILVSQSRFLVINTPAALPNLTIHRLALLALFLGWLQQPAHREGMRQLPFGREFHAWLAVGALSLMGSTNFGLSVRSYLSFVLEIYLLFLILSTSVRTREAALSILWSVFLGLTLVAGIAIAERYYGLNPLHALHPATIEFKRGTDIVSTMDHRILMGAGMAMGWPVGISLLSQVKPVGWRGFGIWTAIAMLIAACYFSMSRGPWVASVLAGIGLVVLLPRGAKRPIYLIAGLAVVVLLARPGVWTTLSLRTEDTFETDSFKHGTFMYRLELWRVAYEGIEDSTWRLLFGNGPGVAGESDFDWTLSYSDADHIISSWDNHYATFLYNTGFLGLLAVLTLLGAVLLRMLKDYRVATPSRRPMLAAILCSGGIYFFMMSNVFIFAPQLNYVFWSLVAGALAIGSNQAGPSGVEPAIGLAGGRGREAKPWPKQDPAKSRPHFSEVTPR